MSFDALPPPKEAAVVEQPIVQVLPPAPLQPWELSREEVEIVKKSIAPGATDEELKYCLAVSRRYKLDPFRQQIWFVPRNKRWKDGNEWRSEKTWIPVVGINGLQHIAARDHEDYGSISEPEFGPMHDVKYNGDNKIQTLQAPQWAKVAVWKKGSDQPTVATVWWDEIYPNIDSAPLVRQMPRLMLAKCARAQAIREAYPATDGLYTREEFAGMRPDYTPDGHEIPANSSQVASAELEKDCKEISAASDASVLKFLFTVAYEKAEAKGDRNAMKLIAAAKDARKKELGYANR